MEEKPRPWELEVAAHTLSTVEEQRQMDVCVQLSFPVLWSSGPLPRGWPHYSEQILLPQLIQSRQPPQPGPEAHLSGDWVSSSSQWTVTISSPFLFWLLAQIDKTFMKKNNKARGVTVLGFELYLKPKQLEQPSTGIADTQTIRQNSTEESSSR